LVAKEQREIRLAGLHASAAGVHASACRRWSSRFSVFGSFRTTPTIGATLKTILRLHTAAAAEYLGVAQNTIRKWPARADIPIHMKPTHRGVVPAGYDAVLTDLKTG
jgi:hypothetical protein